METETETETETERVCSGPKAEQSRADGERGEENRGEETADGGRRGGGSSHPIPNGDWATHHPNLPCVVQRRKHGAPVRGWQQQLLSRTRPPALKVRTPSAHKTTRGGMLEREARGDAPAAAAPTGRSCSYRARRAQGTGCGGRAGGRAGVSAIAWLCSRKVWQAQAGGGQGQE